LPHHDRSKTGTPGHGSFADWLRGISSKFGFLSALLRWDNKEKEQQKLIKKSSALRAAGPATKDPGFWCVVLVRSLIRRME